MFKFTHSIQNELKENFYNLKEKASNTKSDSDQANQR